MIHLAESEEQSSREHCVLFVEKQIIQMLKMVKLPDKCSSGEVQCSRVKRFCYCEQTLKNISRLTRFSLKNIFPFSAFKKPLETQIHNSLHSLTIAFHLCCALQYSFKFASFHSSQNPLISSKATSVILHKKPGVPREKKRRKKRNLCAAFRQSNGRNVGSTTGK